MNDETLYERMKRIASDITLPEQFAIEVNHDDDHELHYFQIACWRMDVVTGEMGMGYGGPGYVNPLASDSQLVSLIFGLYLRYVEHEARETFEWRGKRIYGPHIDVNALWEVARRVDVRSAMHVGDRGIHDHGARDSRDDDLDLAGYRADPHYDLGGSPQ
jgi:hypothetical protein